MIKSSPSARQAAAADVHDIYQWIDRVTFSRIKTRLNRDFADAGNEHHQNICPSRPTDLHMMTCALIVVMAAELIHFYFPKLVNLHNYSSRNSYDGRIENWNALNRKVMSKLNLELRPDTIHQLASCTVGSAEVLLRQLRTTVSALCLRLDSTELWHFIVSQVIEPLPLTFIFVVAL